MDKLDAHEIQPEEYLDIPELTDEWFDKAGLRYGRTVLRRGLGRRPLDNPKKHVSLRLDTEVLARFRAAGPGWQSRINAALRRHLGRRITRSREPADSPIIFGQVTGADWRSRDSDFDWVVLMLQLSY